MFGEQSIQVGIPWVGVGAAAGTCVEGLGLGQRKAFKETWLLGSLVGVGLEVQACHPCGSVFPFSLGLVRLLCVLVTKFISVWRLVNFESL